LYFSTSPIMNDINLDFAINDNLMDYTSGYVPV